MTFRGINEVAQQFDRTDITYGNNQSEGKKIPPKESCEHMNGFTHCTSYHAWTVKT